MPERKVRKSMLNKQVVVSLSRRKARQTRRKRRYWKNSKRAVKMMLHHHRCRTPTTLRATMAAMTNMPTMDMPRLMLLQYLTRMWRASSTPCVGADKSVSAVMCPVLCTSMSDILLEGSAGNGSRAPRIHASGNTNPMTNNTN
jgi:hypothetical protein